MMPRDPAHGDDIKAPGDDFPRGSLLAIEKYPVINLLFAAISNLIVCSTMKIGLLQVFNNIQPDRL